MRIYLAGPMRGYPNSNEAAFEYWAAILRDKGHEVFSPPEEGDKLFGPRSNRVGGLKGQPEAILRTCFLLDTSWICHNADAVALIDGWENSKGATAERALAYAIGLQVGTVREF